MLKNARDDEAGGWTDALDDPGGPKRLWSGPAAV
jgi:hypothetical protein